MCSGERFPALSLGWQAAFRGAWAAFLAGTVPIGAAILDSGGRVVAAAHNAILDGESPNLIRDHTMAHAEINAILQLNEFTDHRDIRSYHLYTTTEPCPLCMGAIIMGSIRRFSFAARDPIAGSAVLTQATPYIRGKSIRSEGPFPLLEAIDIIMKMSQIPMTEKDPARIQWFIEKKREINPPAVAAGLSLYEDGTLPRLYEKKAPIEEAWPIMVERFKMQNPS